MSYYDHASLLALRLGPWRDAAKTGHKRAAWQIEAERAGAGTPPLASRASVDRFNPLGAVVARLGLRQRTD